MRVLHGCSGAEVSPGFRGAQTHNDAYDFLFKRNPAAPIKTQAIVVGIDDATFSAMGGPRRMRPILTKALLLIAEGQPKAVAIDILLHDQGREPADIAEDTALAGAIRKNRNVILPTNLDGDRWEDPAPVFVPPGGVLGHIKADVGSSDGVTRQIPLSQSAGRRRSWALALEAFRITAGASDIVESMNDIEIGNLLIPAAHEKKYPLRIVYASDPVARIAVVDLVDRPELAARLN